MRRKIFYMFLGIVGIVCSFLFYTYADIFGLLPSGGAGKIAYDYSIKTEVGKPIKVARVIDGDTIELINGDRLRYIGIDTPEEVDRRKPVQCFAAEAAAKNRELVEGKIITFHKDVSDHDRYGRWLGFVHTVDGAFVNLELVKNGYAFAWRYPPDVSMADQFEQAQDAARQNGLGLWKKCTIHKTHFGREQTQSLSETFAAEIFKFPNESDFSDSNTDLSLSSKYDTIGR